LAGYVLAAVAECERAPGGASKSEGVLLPGRMGSAMPDFVTNIRVYLVIAEEAAAESRRLDDAATVPKPDGQPGVVMAHDPQRRSFRQSFIAIAFAGMYLEALLALVGRERLGDALYKKIDRAHTNYEEKLRLLGVHDAELLADCKRFREARNDLMHEKAIDLDSPDPTEEWRTAQHEASFAVETIRAIANALRT